MFMKDDLNENLGENGKTAIGMTQRINQFRGQLIIMMRLVPGVRFKNDDILRFVGISLDLLAVTFWRD